MMMSPSLLPIDKKQHREAFIQQRQAHHSHHVSYDSLPLRSNQTNSSMQTSVPHSPVHNTTNSNNNNNNNNNSNSNINNNSNNNNHVLNNNNILNTNGTNPLLHMQQPQNINSGQKPDDSIDLWQEVQSLIQLNNYLMKEVIRLQDQQVQMQQNFELILNELRFGGKETQDVITRVEEMMTELQTTELINEFGETKFLQGLPPEAQQNYVQHKKELNNGSQIFYSNSSFSSNDITEDIHSSKNPFSPVSQPDRPFLFDPPTPNSSNQPPSPLPPFAPSGTDELKLFSPPTPTGYPESPSFFIKEEDQN